MGIVCPRARASSFFLKGHKDPDLSSSSPLAFCSLSDTLVYHTHSRLWVLCQTRSTLQVHSLACHSLPSLPRYKRRPTPRESLIYSPPLGKRSYFNSKYRSSGSRNLAVPFFQTLLLFINSCCLFHISQQHKTPHNTIKMRGLPLHENDDEPQASCISFSFRRSCFGGMLSYWRPLGRRDADQHQQRDVFEKKYVHVPTHAASSFMQTATPREMKKANEII